MRRTLRVGFGLSVVLLVSAYFGLWATPAFAKSKAKWSPGSVNVTTPPGRPISKVLTFRTSAALNSIRFVARGTGATYVRFSPSSIRSLKKGKSAAVRVMITVPAVARRNSYVMTIYSTAKGKSVAAKLRVKITIPKVPVSYKVIVVGDSISDVGPPWGVLSGDIYLPQNGGTVPDYWVSLMTAWLNVTYPQCTWNVVDLAKSGWTTGDFVPNNITGGANYDGRILASNGGANADFCVMLLGLNDTISYSLSSQTTYLDWLVPHLPADGVVCTLLPVETSKYTDGITLANEVAYGNNTVSKVTTAHPAWKVADVYAAFTAAGNPDRYHTVGDGLHPSVAGQAFLWSVIQPQVESMLGAAGVAEKPRGE